MGWLQKLGPRLLMSDLYWIDAGRLPGLVFLGDAVTGSGETVWGSRFRGCESFEPIEALTVKISKDGQRFPLMFAYLGMPVADTQVAEIFREYGARDVEFIPARVQGEDEPHYILNVLRCLDCINDFRTLGTRNIATGPRPDRVGHYDSMLTLALDREVTAGYDVFRPARFTAALVVSERVFDRLTAIVGQGLWCQGITLP
jgi:hypothetical protein